jgi:hypothetical protein
VSGQLAAREITNNGLTINTSNITERILAHHKISGVWEPSWIQEEDNLLLSLLEFDDESSAKISEGTWIEIAGVMNTQAPAAGIYLRT